MGSGAHCTLSADRTTESGLICPSGLLRENLSSPFCKNILIFRRPKSVVCLLPSCPTQRGGSRRHGRGAGCGGRGGALDGRCLQRTAKTGGPDTPTLVSSWRINPRNDGGKKADHRGEHGISRKPLRAGMSGVFRWLAVNTRVHTCYHSAHEAAGASGARHSPRPLFSGRMVLATLGRIAPRECKG